MKNSNSNKVIADFGPFGSLSRLEDPEEIVNAIAEFIDSKMIDNAFLEILISKLDKLEPSYKTMPQHDVLERLKKIMSERESLSRHS